MNPRRLAPNFAGMLLLSAVLFFNIIAIIIAVAGNFLNRSNVMGINITIMLFIISINYFLLIYNGKAEVIIDLYDERFKNESHGKWRILLVVFYIILTVIVACYFATISRNNIRS